MTPKFLLTICLLVIASFSFAQKHNDYFLKNNGKYVSTLDSADYIRKVSGPDSGSNLFNVIELYKNGTRKLIGKSLKMDTPSYEGQVLTNFENGHKKRISNYLNGRISGLEYQYYPNGKLYIVNEFPDTGKRKMALPNTPLVLECYDSIGTKLVSEGNGYFKGYDESFKYLEWQGKIKNGEKDSLWNGFNKMAKVGIVELYNNGKLLNGYETDLTDEQEGVIISYSSKSEIPPQFRGGLDAFYRYINSNLIFPEDAKKNNYSGKLILKFVIEKDGSILDVVIIKGVCSSIDKEGIRIIKNSPQWIPGFQNGRWVRTSYTVPISFSLK